jgi:hypothetical protein
MFLNFLPQSDIRDLGEEPARDLLGEPLFLIVRVADWHIKYCLLQALIFTFRERLNH